MTVPDKSAVYGEGTLSRQRDFHGNQLERSRLWRADVRPKLWRAPDGGTPRRADARERHQGYHGRISFVCYGVGQYVREQLEREPAYGREICTGELQADFECFAQSMQATDCRIDAVQFRSKVLSSYPRLKELRCVRYDALAEQPNICIRLRALQNDISCVHGKLCLRSCRILVELSHESW